MSKTYRYSDPWDNTATLIIDDYSVEADESGAWTPPYNIVLTSPMGFEQRYVLQTEEEEN